MIVTNEEDLRLLVREYLRRDSFVFDLETMYTPDEEEQAEADRITAKSPKHRTSEEEAWMDDFNLRPADPSRNEVIWIGLATYGRSDSVATGHPHGRLIKPRRQEKILVTDLFEEGDPRLVTKGGKISKRKVIRTLPAVFAPPPPQLDVSTALEIMAPLFFSDQEKANQNIGFDLKTLAKYYGGTMPHGPYFELQVGFHVLDEDAFRTWDLLSFTEKHLAHSYNKLAAKGVTNFSFEEAAKYAEQDARFTWLLKQKIDRQLAKDPTLRALFEFEMQVYGPLRRQEMRGVHVDRKRMDEMRIQYHDRLKDILDELIVDYGAPENFNPNSNNQKIDLIFKKHKVQPIKRTNSGGISVDAASLQTIADGNHSVGSVVVREGKSFTIYRPGSKDDEVSAIARLLLAHAETAKLIGTYIIGMGSRLDPEGVLRPSFTQHATDTGRLSCRNPNIQNIPRGSDMRDLFYAPPGYKLITVDYDQVELRFICFLSQDETMRQIFLNEEQDIHTETARAIMKALGKNTLKMTKEDRTVYGKVPNFLIGYGGTEYRLAASTGLDLEAGKAIINAYYKQFSALPSWKASVLADAMARMEYREVNGVSRMVVPPYVESLLGRRRRLPHLALSTKGNLDKEEWKRRSKLKSAAERQGINFKVQGSAAEALKTAMIDVDTHVLETGFPMQVVMNIHDELVAVVPDRHADEGLAIIVEKMENVVNYRTGKPFLEGYVPLVASGKVDSRWSKS